MLTIWCWWLVCWILTATTTTTNQPLQSCYYLLPLPPPTSPCSRATTQLCYDSSSSMFCSALLYYCPTAPQRALRLDSFFELRAQQAQTSAPSVARATPCSADDSRVNPPGSGSARGRGCPRCPLCCTTTSGGSRTSSMSPTSSQDA